MKRQKKRSSNYTSEECWKLVKLAIQYKHILENKKTDLETWEEKTKTWNEICFKFNSGTTTPRTRKQLRSKFDSLKKETRKDWSMTRGQLPTTGDPFEERTVNPLYKEIRNMIQLPSKGMASGFDYDGLEENTTNMPSKPFEVIAVCDASEAKLLWFNEDSNGVLNTNQNGLKCDDPNILDLVNQNDIQVGICSPRPLPVIDGSDKHLPFTSSTTDVNKDDLKKNKGHNLMNQQPNPLDDMASGTSSNEKTPYVKRQLVSTRPTPVTKSSSGKRLRSWTDARKDLAVTQQQLLVKEFEARQKRELEIHEQVLIIKKLKVKKLQLEIEIKKVELSQL